MSPSDLFASIMDFLSGSAFKMGLTVASLALFRFVNRATRPRIEESVDRGRFRSASATRARHATRFLSGLVLICALAFIWGIGFHAILLLSTTVLTLTGVALFANWSLLSNITAFFVLLLHPSFRRGTFVRVMELDNYIEGYISDINLFNTILITESRETVVYPNNLLIARPTLINPRNRFNVIGKSAEFLAQRQPESEKLNVSKT